MASQDLISEMGWAALDMLDGRVGGKVLVYAEVDEHFMALDVFFTESDGVVRYRRGSTSLAQLVRSFWKEARSGAEEDEWRVMCYVLDGERMNIDLTYPPAVHSEDSIVERRPRALRRYFGTEAVDYSQP